MNKTKLIANFLLLATIMLVVISVLGVALIEPSNSPNIYPALTLLCSWNLIVVGVFLLLPQRLLFRFFTHTFLGNVMKTQIKPLVKRFVIGVLWVILGLLVLCLRIQGSLSALFKK